MQLEFVFVINRVIKIFPHETIRRHKDQRWTLGALKQHIRVVQLVSLMIIFDKRKSF